MQRQRFSATSQWAFIKGLLCAGVAVHDGKPALPLGHTSWGSWDLLLVPPILLCTFHLSLCRAPPECLHLAGCKRHHRQGLAQLVEGAGREGFLEEEVPG